MNNQACAQADGATPLRRARGRRRGGRGSAPYFAIHRRAELC